MSDLQLQSAELTFGIITSLAMPLAIDLHIEGTNAAGTMVPLDATLDVPAVSGGQAELVTIVLNEQNSTIVGFLNNLPTTVVFDGVARIGDGVSIGTVASTDSVSARWAISAPMTVALLAQTIDSDATSIDLGDQLRQDLEERLIELTLEADVISTLPVEATIWIGIDTNINSVHTTPALRLGPITIAAAAPARPDGTREGVVRTARIVVAEADVPLITQPSTWQGIRIELPGTDGNFVTLRASDRVEVRGFLRARILMGEINR